MIKFTKLDILSLSALLAAIFVVPASAQTQETETRNISGFEGVSARGSDDVDVKVGGQFHVEVKGDPKLLSLIETTVEDGVLVIKRKKDEKRERHLRGSATISITMPKIKEFHNHGSGDGNVSGIKADEFSFSQYGSGDVSMSGTCGHGTFKLKGSGDMYSKGLTCKRVEIETVGSGDMRLSVSDELSLQSHGSGDVDIYGSPKIKRMKTTGSGDFSIID